MDSRVVLQVPIEKSLKEKAEKVALTFGFSSLQEIVRVFMAKLATKRISVSFSEDIYLSERANKRYSKSGKDIKNKKNLYKAESVDDLMNQLHGNTLPQKLS